MTKLGDTSNNAFHKGRARSAKTSGLKYTVNIVYCGTLIPKGETTSRKIFIADKAEIVISEVMFDLAATVDGTQYFWKAGQFYVHDIDLQTKLDRAASDGNHGLFCRWPMNTYPVKEHQIAAEQFNDLKKRKNVETLRQPEEYIKDDRETIVAHLSHKFRNTVSVNGEIMKPVAEPVVFVRYRNWSLPYAQGKTAICTSDTISIARGALNGSNYTLVFALSQLDEATQCAEAIARQTRDNETLENLPVPPNATIKVYKPEAFTYDTFTPKAVLDGIICPSHLIGKKGRKSDASLIFIQRVLEALGKALATWDIEAQVDWLDENINLLEKGDVADSYIREMIVAFGAGRVDEVRDE
jgi:hypothetical protein